MIEEMGNPLTDDSSDLVSLDTVVIMSNEVVNATKTAEDLGRTQYQTFGEEHMSDASIYGSIHKNNLPLFNSGQKKSTHKSEKTTQMKRDVQFFTRMYISCQSRDGGFDTFFEHENQPWPPLFAENNAMHLSNKAGIMVCLEALAECPQDTPVVALKVIDEAALVHALDSKRSNMTGKTFGEFGQKVFSHTSKDSCNL